MYDSEFRYYKFRLVKGSNSCYVLKIYPVKMKLLYIKADLMREFY